MTYINKYFIILFALALFSCRDAITVVDTNIELKNRNWSYAEKIKIPVKIESTEEAYNLYINLRHTDQYKYSNIFILIHSIDPSGKKTTERKEFTLALADGEWLGSGSGNKLFYQFKFKSKYKFPKSGTYIFELEQNMRDNPLNHISDAGIRVEKSQ
jgi:gliding motility-associated lipoprotein GldH